MTLIEWHDKLSAHFSNLHKQRLDADFPVFAIEHDLSRQELIELKDAIRAHISAYEPSNAHWLPWIVYAAEIGYEFDGHEYWDSFAEKTPYWKTHGDRHFIKNSFKKFVQSFGGFTPSGAWADHFTIICYPITHAVLPKDLQRQLAKVLYNLRFQFSRSFLHSPEHLGGRIAERSDETSRRFQQFAGNTGLVGLIARELLSHDETGSDNIILPSTLKRIVEDLRLERDAGSWLDQARSAARENFRRAGNSENIEREYAPRAELKPDLMLRPVSEAKWDLYLEIPDLLPLAERSAELYEFLKTSRPKINGSFFDKRLGTGKLVSHGSLREKLKSLPDAGKPLLLFRREEPAALKKFLEVEFALKTKDKILFRKRADGVAYKQESNVVRPICSYLMLSSGIVPNDPLVTKQNSSCENFCLYLLTIPKTISADNEIFLDSLGLRTDVGIEIMPIGSVPAAWNEENRIEWLADESPCFSLELNRVTEMLKLELGEDKLEIPNPPIGEPLLINLSYFPIGSHRLRISGKSRNDSDYQILGDTKISIREPRSFSADSTTTQNALLLFTDPFRPSFEQLFSDRVSFDFWTPPETNVNVYLNFMRKDSENDQLLRRLLTTVSLPNQSNELNANIRQALKQDEVVKQTEAAHYCTLEFDAGELGTVSASFEREFLPLRWEAKTDKNGQLFLRLSDESDSGEKISVVRYDFAAPNRIERVPHFQTNDSDYPVPTVGGLFVAQTSHIERGMVVLRHDKQSAYKSFADIGRAQAFVPKFERVARDNEQLSELIDLYCLWVNSPSIGNVFRKTDLTVIANGFLLEIVSLVDDAYGWRRSETQYLADRNVGYNSLRKAVSPKHSLVDKLSDSCSGCINIASEEWIDKLVSVLGNEIPTETIKIQKTGKIAHMRAVKPDWFAEFALRLCSRPDTLRKWAAEKYELGLKKMLERPTLVRAARFVVLTARGEKLSDGRHRIYKWNWE